MYNVHTTALQQYRSTFVAEEIRCDIFHYNITVLGYLIHKKLTITVGSQTNIFQNSNIISKKRTNEPFLPGGPVIQRSRMV